MVLSKSMSTDTLWVYAVSYTVQVELCRAGTACGNDAATGAATGTTTGAATGAATMGQLHDN